MGFVISASGRASVVVINDWTVRHRSSVRISAEDPEQHVLRACYRDTRLENT